jgi:hypothetical protein
MPFSDKGFELNSIWLNDLELLSSIDLSVHIEAFEIYNESIYDLQSTQKTSEKCRLRDNKNHFQVEGLSKNEVASEKDLNKLLKSILLKRKVHSNSLNCNSSRSHTVFRIILDFQVTFMKQDVHLQNVLNGLDSQAIASQSSAVYESQTISRVINIVDLAGSERFKRTENNKARLKEANFVNKSLSCLGRCLQALKDKKNVPYRETKLTQFLSEFFFQDNQIGMIANINPCQQDFDETFRVLQYANTATEIQPIKSKLKFQRDSSFVSKSIHGRFSEHLHSKRQGLGFNNNNPLQSSLGSSGLPCNKGVEWDWISQKIDRLEKLILFQREKNQNMINITNHMPVNYFSSQKRLNKGNNRGEYFNCTCDFELNVIGQKRYTHNRIQHANLEQCIMLKIEQQQRQLNSNSFSLQRIEKILCNIQKDQEVSPRKSSPCLSEKFRKFSEDLQEMKQENKELQLRTIELLQVLNKKTSHYPNMSLNSPIKHRKEILSGSDHTAHDLLRNFGRNQRNNPLCDFPNSSEEIFQQRKFDNHGTIFSPNESSDEKKLFFKGLNGETNCVKVSKDKDSTSAKFFRRKKELVLEDEEQSQLVPASLLNSKSAKYIRSLHESELKQHIKYDNLPLDKLFECINKDIEKDNKYRKSFFEDAGITESQLQ